MRVSTDAPVSAFGGGQAAAQVGEAVRDVGDSVIAYAKAEKKKALDIEFMDHDLKLSQLKTELQINGENMRGKDAAGVTEYINKEWSTRASEITSGISDPDLMAAVERAKSNHFGDLNKFAQIHQNREFQKHDLEQTMAYVEVSRDEAVLNYQDPSRIEQSLYRQQAAVTKSMARFGIEEGSPQAIKMRKEVESETHAAVINRMLADGKDSLAEKYFSENKDKIDSKKSDALKKNLEEGSVRGKSQRSADLIVARAESMADALEKARQIGDPKVRDATEDRIKDYYRLQELATEERQRQVFTAALKSVDEAGIAAQKPPPDQWNAMSVQQQNSLLARIDRLRGGEAVTTDRSTYQKLAHMAASDPAKFKREDLQLYGEKLSLPDYKKFVDMQNEAKSGNTKKLDGFLGAREVVKSVLPKELRFAKSGTDKARRAEDFINAVNLQAERIQEQTGKTLSDKELRELAEDLRVEGIVSKPWGPFGIFGGEKKMLFEFDPAVDTEGFRHSYEDIPSREKQRIREAFQAEGVPFTEQDVLDVYVDKKKNLVPRGR